MLKYFILFFIVYVLYSTYSNAMSDNTKKLTQEEKDAEYFNPDNLVINAGGKSVPFSQINKPHHAVIQPRDHQANINVNEFPDIEPAAKEREAKIAAARKQQ